MDIKDIKFWERDMTNKVGISVIFEDKKFEKITFYINDKLNQENLAGALRLFADDIEKHGK